ncbi:MAG: hypothetical protein ABH836_01035 [Candidatus Omnitrophota bacterium]
MYIRIEVYKTDDNSFIAMCPELNLSSNGKSEEQAVDRLKREIIVCVYLPKINHGDEEIKATGCFYGSGKPGIH